MGETATAAVTAMIRKVLDEYNQVKSKALTNDKMSNQSAKVPSTAIKKTHQKVFFKDTIPPEPLRVSSQVPFTTDVNKINQDSKEQPT